MALAIVWRHQRTKGFLMPITRLLQIIASVCGVIAITLGIGTYTHADLITIHMLFGLLVALALLVLAILAASTRGLRRLGIIGIVFALVVPIFGVTQQMIWVGSWHWLVEAAHLFVGVGAIMVTGTITARFTLLRKRTEASPAALDNPATPAQPVR
jgi:hypothetical protein